MARKRNKPARREGFLQTYRRIRKPMPPPERVIGDERRKLEEEVARMEMEEARGERAPEDR